MNNDEFSKLAHSRRSTRDFRPDPVPQSDIDAILADGMSAPSWSNTRPFMVAVARGEQRDRISRALVARLRENAEAPGMGMNPDYTHEIPYPPYSVLQPDSGMQLDIKNNKRGISLKTP